MKGAFRRLLHTDEVVAAGALGGEPAGSFVVLDGDASFTGRPARLAGRPVGERHRRIDARPQPAALPVVLSGGPVRARRWRHPSRIC